LLREQLIVDNAGVLYIATKPEFVAEAQESAVSLTDHNPDLNVTLFTTEPYELDVFDQVQTFDDLPSVKRAKLFLLSETPYKKTLYLDSDTYIAGDISPVYSLLEQFDVAAAHAPKRTYQGTLSFPAHGVESEQEFGKVFDITAPDCFPEYNGGVLAYRTTPATLDFLDLWEEIYTEHVEQPNFFRDQPSLRESLYRSDVRLGTLPPEYNCRIWWRRRLRQAVSGPVKIFHGRPRESDLETIATYVNGHIDRGVFITIDQFRVGQLVSEVHQLWSLREKFLASVKNNGIRDTLKKTIRFIR
jgi:hypothetical protein